MIQTCIICENTTVEERAELKECIIGAKHTVEAGGGLSPLSVEFKLPKCDIAQQTQALK